MEGEVTVWLAEIWLKKEGEGGSWLVPGKETGPERLVVYIAAFSEKEGEKSPVIGSRKGRWGWE
jgi:hypothetical protein